MGVLRHTGGGQREQQCRALLEDQKKVCTGLARYVGWGVRGEFGDRAGGRSLWAFGATVKMLEFILNFR